MAGFWVVLQLPKNSPAEEIFHFHIYLAPNLSNYLFGTEGQRKAPADSPGGLRVAQSVPTCWAAAAVTARVSVQEFDFIVADAPGGLEELSRTVLILADLAFFPVLPSILDLRSVAEATKLLKFAQSINAGRPEGRLILNRLRKRDRISRELADAAPALGLKVAQTTIRDLQAYRNAAQQGTVVTRMGARERDAATEVTQLTTRLQARTADALRRAYGYC
jgi:septum formation inhibitor-activating ATPase MinD